MKDSYKKHLIECDGYAYFMAGSSQQSYSSQK